MTEQKKRGRPAKPKVEKECPVCKVIHYKAGTYCSKICSNKGRTVTDEQKKKTAESMTKFMNSDDDVAEEARWRIQNFHKNPDEHEAIVPGYIPDDPYYRDGSDIWFEVDND